ncbi:MAG: O-methyltransferase [Bacteroides sp.]|nr:O-methyltransferase [Bacteroides sp.]MCM1378660.1 O-methyltransferase [Bacteroides sp.]MCM1444933.1 O-methyltransferase [Prevotella sp.]
MDAELESYILNHIETEPERLHELDRATQLYHLYPHQCSGHLQGRLLSMLSYMIRPRRVLELGTFTGYSAICLAEGLAPDGELHTVEHNDEDEDALRQLFAADNRITLHIGDASAYIEKLPGTWDLVYIDANKREYSRYLELILPKMTEGGFIIADNTLWAGKVTDSDERDAQTQGIRDFNEKVKRLENRIHPVILPLRDGITLMRYGTENH